MRTFTLEALHAKAARTGWGAAYIADVLAQASDVTATHYDLTDDALAALRLRWKSQPAPAPRGPCEYIGEPTGQTVPCETCRGKTTLKIFACGVHSTCTPQTRVVGVHCCDGCNEYAKSQRLTQSNN